MAARKLKIKPRPDFGRLEKVLRRQALPDRVPFYELYSNIEAEVLQAIGKAGESVKKLPDGSDLETRLLNQHITYQFHLGYDYIIVNPKNFEFPRGLPYDLRPPGFRELSLAGSLTNRLFPFRESRGAPAGRDESDCQLLGNPGKCDVAARFRGDRLPFI